jgi:Putative adhesin
MRIIPATLAAFAFTCASTLIYAANPGFQKTFTASGPTTLRICNNSGQIHVTGVDGGKIQISADIHKGSWHEVGNGGDMKKIAANPPVKQTGGVVQVGDSTTCGSNGAKGIDIDYEISVPKSTNVAVNIGAGAIKVDSIGGFVHADTGSGDIAVNAVGPDSRLVTGSGNLDIQAAHGMLLVRTGSGSVNLRDSNVSDSQLRVGSGTITATNLQGGVRASTGNGNIAMGGTPTAEWEMRTGNGTIGFQANASAKFELDAETGSGMIDSSLPAPLSGHITSGVLRGPVNGGGPVVKMYTGNGNITLQ